MTKRKIPDDPTGYSVTPDGLVHTRYAVHADGRRTRAREGVEALGGTAPCPECYPPPERKRR